MKRENVYLNLSNLNADERNELSKILHGYEGEYRDIWKYQARVFCYLVYSTITNRWATADAILLDELEAEEDHVNIRKPISFDDFKKYYPIWEDEQLSLF